MSVDRRESVSHGNSTAESGEVGRIALLALLGVVTVLWLGHHADWGFVNAVVAVAAVVGAALTATVTVLKLCGVKLDEWIQPRLRRALAPVATPGFLWTAGLALLLLMATCSSIKVVAEDGADAVLVTVVAADRAGARTIHDTASGEKPARFPRLATNPLGRFYRVEAPGYVAASFPVYPLAARRVVLGRDLLPVPSVLFRPFVKGVSALADGAVFRVMRVDSQNLQLLAADTGTTSSFLLGRPQAPTAAMMAFWRLQLEAVDAPQGELSRMLMLWSNPRQLQALDELNANDSLVAEIVLYSTRSNDTTKKDTTVVARAGVRLGPARLADVLLAEVPR